MKIGSGKNQAEIGKKECRMKKKEGMETEG